MSVKFSIVINTLNRARTLESAISGALGQEHDSFEVIVINGPSTDETAAVLSKFRARITYRNIPDRNLDISRNAGIAMASGELIAFLDDDAVPEPYWLKSLEIPFANPRVAVAGGYIRDKT